MANIKSAKKRVRIGERNRKMNRFYKSNIKTLVKKYRLSIKTFETTRDVETYETLQTLISKIYSKIDKAAKKKVFHLRKAARQKSRISNVLKKVGKP
ncbi:30S ribosomal protein S20 (chloroplast) [Nannochloropsis gaditana]|uniref:Small ribosomal subunit protein bS20c n=1 Tax=Nannochloropsis gaditana TaxID=72520 RepID=K9ZX69_9STRA|nr:30S ribosomal protein S20 [Nannochloropsis gaditana]AFZ64298.1 30S ribosomal protein S20 [Nannochloropsis gaditana]AGI98685.1 ribosomal protein S20 [Nannochloropsis gaditana]AHX25081.1 30S ribosomal protein S20 [Nannochloropsis gaditana]